MPFATNGIAPPEYRSKESPAVRLQKIIKLRKNRFPNVTVEDLFINHIYNDISA